MALGPRWLAFPSALDERHANGFAASSTATFTARDDYSLTNVAQGVASSLYFLSQVGRKSLSTSFAATSDETRDVGSVVVHDVVHGANLVQFKAHDSPITTLTFDPSGQLLVTSSKKGQTLHVHRLLGDDHVLLYKLQRGITYARIHHVSISVDAKWIAVTSLRGTTHVYAIWPQGGPVDGHCHADMDYDDAPQVAASKAVAVLEQQARDLGRPSWSTEKIQSLLRLRHTTPMNNTATAFQYDDDDLPALHLQCQWGPNNTLYVANAGTLKTMQLQPKLSVLETQSFALSAEMTQLHSVDLEHRPTHPVVQNVTSTSPTPALSSVEVKTHHRPSIPLWAHPKITFRAVRHADGSSRVLSVRRLGPVPLPTDAADKVHERVTQGESPVFDGAAKPKKQHHLAVPTLDLAASISKAVQSSVEIAPIDDHGLDAGVQSLNLAHIQDTYFASPPLAPLSDLVSVHVLPPVLSDGTDTSLDEPFEEIVAETSTTHDDPPRAKSKGRRGSKVKAK
ncbi:hypothetical protein SPRG_02047 [Saprolegnia parasitica CBS 223.65]|uniref:BCAS3 WD40 domain-containing protein n=1 Tax=Saprolegnia parasitica (strain CBS 223.65) TaxID=695850 RepID=A0A067D2J6_SAPPC|nr:hypothetical protein SPRG_02047 [Saprolegnia parasitica CBS 223.65]KDO33237.1 hypothetical protein SPRG_02047 [Saprolegnia parasitica CBS 223.65]|eukprot:XP_012195994.1 hypothetical protein SPRG_02047 [Saprolegnia parasitica CBS 223.65]